MEHLIEEFNRLAGVGPRIVEKASGADPAMLAALSKAFSTKVKLGDVKYLQYRKAGKGVELEDKAARFGGILTSVEPRDADPSMMIAFLKKHGAKPFKEEVVPEEIMAVLTEGTLPGHRGVDDVIENPGGRKVALALFLSDNKTSVQLSDPTDWAAHVKSVRQLRKLNHPSALGWVPHPHGQSLKALKIDPGVIKDLMPVVPKGVTAKVAAKKYAKAGYSVELKASDGTKWFVSAGGRSKTKFMHKGRTYSVVGVPDGLRFEPTGEEHRWDLP